jgi:hypothetical protein
MAGRYAYSGKKQKSSFRSPTPPTDHRPETFNAGIKEENEGW